MSSPTKNTTYDIGATAELLHGLRFAAASYAHRSATLGAVRDGSAPSDASEAVNRNAKKGEAAALTNEVNHFDQMEALLRRGADPNATLKGAAADNENKFDAGNALPPEAGWTLLHFAACDPFRAPILCCCDAGADVNRRTDDADAVTAVMLAAAAGNHLRIDRLVRTHHADVNLRDARGRTALHWAALAKKPNAVSTLLGLGADASIADNEGLKAASLFGISAQDNITASGSAGTGAAKSKDGEADPSASATDRLRQLLAIAADVNESPNDVSTNDKHWLDAMEEQIQRGARPDTVAPEGAKGARRGWTVLHHAACNPHRCPIQDCMKAKASVDLPTADGLSMTPLMLAAKAGYHVRVRRLVAEYCADMGAKDALGNTALHHASLSGSAPCVDALVQLGADVKAKNQAGQTALEVAANDMVKVVFLA